MPIIKEDGLLLIVKRNRRDGRYNSTYEGRVFKRPATPVRRPSRREYAGKIERHQDSKRDLQKGSNQSTRQRAQPSTRQQNRQSTRQRTQPSTRQQNRQSTRQRTQPSTRQQNRQSTRKRVQPSTREQNEKNVTVCKIRKSTSEKAVPKKPNQSV
jgi:hypothetical protein